MPSILLVILMFLFSAPAHAQEVPAVTAETCPATPEEALREMQGLTLEFEGLGRKTHKPGDLTVMLDEAFDRKCGRELMEIGRLAMIESLVRLERTSAPEPIVAPKDEPTVAPIPRQKTTPPSEVMPAEDEPVPNRVEVEDERTLAPIPRRMPTVPTWSLTKPPPPERIVAPKDEPTVAPEG